MEGKMIFYYVKFLVIIICKGGFEKENYRNVS